MDNADILDVIYPFLDAFLSPDISFKINILKDKYKILMPGTLLVFRHVLEMFEVGNIYFSLKLFQSIIILQDFTILILVLLSDNLWITWSLK